MVITVDPVKLKITDIRTDPQGENFRGFIENQGLEASVRFRKASG